MKNLIPCYCFLLTLFLINTQNVSGDDSGILTVKKVPANLLAKYDTEEAKKHPEHGLLPFNAPCTDCIELLEKRTPDSREFRGELDDKGGRQIFIQKSLGNIHYKDKNGFLVTKDPRMIEEGNSLYAARHQPTPVVIDFKGKWASISTYEKELKFNKDISLVLISKSGETQSFGNGDWSHIVKTDNYTETNFLVQEFYPGVDLQMISSSGRLKTSFIIKSKYFIT